MDAVDKKDLTKPPWLKIRPRFDETYREVKDLVSEMGLHTVCQEATCPNIGECFSARTATFIILGDICTRGCRFCDVRKGKPVCYDTGEPVRVAEACQKLKMRFAVITSVTRDDLPDGGAAMFAVTTKAIKSKIPSCGVELLIPDLMGNTEALRVILDSDPDVLAHNIETVPRLYKRVRPGADYERTLNILKSAGNLREDIIVKSGIMVGLGETSEEVLEVIEDAARHGCRIMTVGQYLRPSKWHLPVEKFYTPEEFERIKKEGEARGMKYIEAAPLVRSSYMAHRQLAFYRDKID
ncbi:MAG: lipoyl synthase [Candidatus Zixiibacteriota bacterium]|nr:MAG: lipoyl synthase [candidate division Zixibacteria bacterium]